MLLDLAEPIVAQRSGRVGGASDELRFEIDPAERASRAMAQLTTGTPSTLLG